MNPVFIVKLFSGRFRLTVFLLLALSGFLQAQADFDPLLDSLERTIEKAPSHIEQKENTIQALMRQATASSIFPEAKFRFYGELLNAYRSYRFDSAFKYVNIRLGLAKEEKRRRRREGDLLTTICSSVKALTSVTESSNRCNGERE